MGIAPLSQFPATVASGAPPRPNHACCEEGVDVCFETLWRRGAEMLHHPCILGDPQQRGQSQSKKRAKKTKTRTVPWCPRSCLQTCSLPPLGFEPRTSNCRGTALPQGYGPDLTYLCTGVVFIFCPIWFSPTIRFSSKN